MCPEYNVGEMRFPNSTLRLVAVLGAAASLALPSLAGAQSYPSYAVAPQQTIKGTITGFNGAYTVYVQDERAITTIFRCTTAR